MDYKTPKETENDTQIVIRKELGLLSAGALCIILALVLLSIDLIQIICNFRSQIKNGSEVYKLLEKELPGLNIYAYLFNVTNAEQFLSGEDHKLKVQEVGPFTYREFRSNQNLAVDEEKQSLWYNPVTRPVFIPEESIADPKDVYVTMPNMAMLAMSSMISPHGYFPKLSFSLLLQTLSTKALVNMTAHDFLWGFEEPLIKLGNTVLPGWISFEKLGLLDRLYDQSREYRVEIATALGDKFKVKSVNGLGGLKVWKYEDPEKRTSCNTFADVYEGIAYPSQMPPGAPVKIYRNVLCRFLDLDYQGIVTSKHGADALYYKIGRFNYDINNNTECLCGNGMCISGISDLSPCYYGLPLALSNAHFLDGGPELFERVEGLEPNEEKHGSEILIERKIGMVLQTTFSVQVNVAVSKIDFHKEAGRFSNMVVPVGYFKLSQPELVGDDAHNLYLMYTFTPALLLAVQILLFIAGFFLIAYSVQLVLSKLAYSKGKGIAFRNPNDAKPPGHVVPLLGIK